MNDIHLFDFLPLYITFPILLAMILASTWVGKSIAKARKKSNADTDGDHLNTIVGANLELLAFILAFSFNLATARFDARKQYLLDEVNAIETTWLRAGLISEPKSSEVKELLRKSVELRITVSKQPEKAKEIIEQSNIIQQKIWAIVSDLTKTEARNDEIFALFVEAVNEMFDDQTKRITVGLVYRIPTLIWIAFLLLLMISMSAVGYLFGKKGKSDWYMILTLAMAFTVVMLIIIDLDRVIGVIDISSQPMYDLHERMLNR